MTNLIEGLNEQMNFEISSAYIYAAMASYCKSKGMEGFAHFMDFQAKEELGHAMDFYKFIFLLNSVPEYEAIAKPATEYGTFSELFKQALEHEKEVTRRIRALYQKATEEKNYEILEFLGGYIKEQVEEENTFRGIVEKMERLGESWTGLYHYDAELGRRA
ncbi:ferritin [Peptoniphilus asaccharolyticus DSM 20463]|uniref:Ferritin n=1 Tax=Peptoniphilus asaccharolyticus DSM 20463 TaxID=573058 RepID=A0A1W1VG86_PEPAS|nr:ferritin [Peptoniphilus asaccharolyticus]MBL7575883.1 ferritin [Peptoniphilus asaccharolyticus]SMB92081.1 ferritin [Peptoniphilus asaccharolyticus DSM 20463]